jgi:large subunit ribosomal protein L22
LEVKSVSKDTGVAPQKIRRLVDLVRGKSVEEALATLKFAPSPNARLVAKVIKAAASDAESVYQMPAQTLKIVSIYADEAQTLKRFRASARRRVARRSRRSSHLTVVVGEQED